MLAIFLAPLLLAAGTLFALLVFGALPLVARAVSALLSLVIIVGGLVLVVYAIRTTVWPAVGEFAIDLLWMAGVSVVAFGGAVLAQLGLDRVFRVRRDWATGKLVKPRRRALKK